MECPSLTSMVPCTSPRLAICVYNLCDCVRRVKSNVTCFVYAEVRNCKKTEIILNSGHFTVFCHDV